MVCPNCQTANLEDAKFCENCGYALERTCPNCGKPAPPAAKFCRNCGYRLTETAAASGGLQQAGVRAAETIAPLGPPSTQGTPPPVSLATSMPPVLRAKLESARAERAMQGERRIVTILFCDVKGSTAMAEQLDPEEWTEIMNSAFEHIIKPVYRYEGTVARLMGDAILAFFGAPIAHEDDPQRAVLSGLGIVEGIQDFREQLRRERGLDFNVRVGINTGLAVVGEVGSDLRVEYTAMGDAVNIAARMEQTARPGSVQIAENTQRAIEPLFDFEPLGGVEVKGKSELVLAYRVLGPKAIPGRLRGIVGLDSPMMGRESELSALQRAAGELRHGRGQIVSVMGEAGLGKSRLMAEFQRWVLESGRAIEDGKPMSTATSALPLSSVIVWREGRSFSYESSTPYSPFIDLFRRWFGLHTGASDVEQVEALKTALAAWAGDAEAQPAPFIAALMGIKLEGEDSDRVKYLQPPQLHEGIFQAVLGLCERAASTQPLLLVFEDLHWADATSLDLIERLMTLTGRAPLMLVAVFRPQRQDPSWRFHEGATRDAAERYTPITLRPLDETHSRELVANLLHVEDLPEAVRALILKKAEGNPFFVEEVIRTLLDAKLVVRDNGHWRATREISSIALPDTLAGVIQARLDRLDDPAKQTAQIASVIGREFPFGLLGEVADDSSTLDSALETLQQRELVREKSAVPERVYLFKHALTQETAYASLLLSRRRQLHRRVAASLEQSDPERIHDLARHWLEAREPVRALPYLIEAGERAARAYATPDAIGYFTRALELLETSPDLRLARRGYEGLGNALSFANEFPRAVESYQQMLALAKRQGDIPMQVSALNKLAFVVALRLGQFPDAERSLADAERLAREAEDKPGLSELSTIRCMMCTAAADFDGVMRYMGETVSLGRELNVKEQLAMGLAHIANTQIFMTHFEEAWQTAQEALQISREIGDRLREAEVLVMPIASYHLRNGDLDGARRAAAHGRNIAAQIGHAFAQILGGWMLGEVARLSGEYDEALTYHERALQVAKPAEAFMPFLMVQPMASLGATYLEISEAYAGRAAELHTYALKLLDTPAGLSGGGTAWADVGFCALALGNATMADEVFQKGLTMPTMFKLFARPRHLVGAALVALEQERFDEAARLSVEARTYVEERAMKYLYPQVAMAEAQVAAARGDHQRALEHYARAEPLARAMTMRPVVWLACAGAAQSLAHLGRLDESDLKRQEASRTISEIAGLFGDESRKTQFLESALRKIG